MRLSGCMYILFQPAVRIIRVSFFPSILRSRSQFLILIIEIGSITIMTNPVDRSIRIIGKGKQSIVRTVNTDKIPFIVIGKRKENVGSTVNFPTFSL